MMKKVGWITVAALGTAALGMGLLLQAEEASPYLIEARVFGTYTVRLEWPCDASDPRYVPVYGKVLTIWKGGEKVAETDWVYELHPLTGVDITGDGYPDVIAVHYSGGAHCCYLTEVFSLGLTVERFPVGKESNCPGEFQDLDGDGIYEFITCDDTFAYVYCCYACSPLVRVVLRFEPGVGYVPASWRFPELYAEDIARDTGLAEQALGDGPFSGWDGTPKCEVLPLVLDYLYSGQIERAWEDLYRYYRYPDVDKFRGEIIERLRGSPYCPL